MSACSHFYQLVGYSPWHCSQVVPSECSLVVPWTFRSAHKQGWSYKVRKNKIIIFSWTFSSFKIFLEHLKTEMNWNFISIFIREETSHWMKKGIRIFAWTVNNPVEKLHFTYNFQMGCLTDTLDGGDLKGLGSSPSMAIRQNAATETESLDILERWLTWFV